MKNIFKLLIIYAAINMGIGILMSILISIYTILLTVGGLATGAGGAVFTAVIAVIVCALFLLIFYFLVKTLFGSAVAAGGSLLTKVSSAVKTGGGKMFGYAGRNLKSLNPYRDAAGGLSNGLRSAFSAAKSVDSGSMYKASRFANLLGANEFANDLRKGARFKSLTENRVHKKGNDGQAVKDDEEDNKSLEAADPQEAEAVNAEGVDDNIIEGEVVDDDASGNKNLSAFVVSSQGEIIPPGQGEEDDNDELSKTTDSHGNVISSSQFAISNPGGQNSFLVNIGGNSQQNQYHQQAFLGGSGPQNAPYAQYSPRAASQLTSPDENTMTDPKLMKNAHRDRVAQQQSAVANMAGMPDGSSEDNAENLKAKRQQRAAANEGRQAESQAGDILSTNSAIYGTVAPSIMTDEGDYSQEAIEKNTQEAQRRYAEGMSDATPAKEKFLNDLRNQHGQKVDLPEEMISGEVEPMTMVNEDDELVVMTDENGNVIARDDYNISSISDDSSLDSDSVEAEDMNITSGNVSEDDITSESQQGMSSTESQDISSSATDMIGNATAEEQDVQAQLQEQEQVQEAQSAGMPNEGADDQQSSGYDADAVRESMSRAQEEKEKETIQARSPQVDSANSQQMTHSAPEAPSSPTPTPEAPSTPAPPTQAQDFASRSSSSDYQDLEKRGVRAFSDDNFSAAATGATLAMIMNEFESRENRSVMGNSSVNLSNDSIVRLADKIRKGESVDSDARKLANEYMNKSEGNGAQYSDIDHDRMVDSFTAAMKSLQNRMIEVSEEETDGIVRKRGNTGERRREDDK